jgi:hypothetical protein
LALDWLRQHVVTVPLPVVLCAFDVARISYTIQSPKTPAERRHPMIVADNLVPGAWVRHPEHPDWGIGQIQSIVGNRITVNFEHAGKLLINSANVSLAPAGLDSAGAEDTRRDR